MGEEYEKRNFRRLRALPARQKPLRRLKQTILIVSTVDESHTTWCFDPFESAWYMYRFHGGLDHVNTICIHG